MAIELRLPKSKIRGESTIVDWFNNVGDKIKEGDSIIMCQVNGNITAVESPASGVLLARMYEDGTNVPNGTIVGYIGKTETIFTADQISTIKKIEGMERLLNIMEEHLNGELSMKEAGELIKDVPEWRKDIAELTEMISKLSGE